MSYWPNNYDVEQRRVQCYCDHIFWSRKEMPQCSKCKIHFYGSERPYKAPEERAKERKTIYELISTIKESQKKILLTLKHEHEENEETIRRIVNLLKPFY